MAVASEQGGNDFARCISIMLSNFTDHKGKRMKLLAGKSVAMTGGKILATLLPLA